MTGPVCGDYQHDWNWLWLESNTYYENGQEIVDNVANDADMANAVGNALTINEGTPFQQAIDKVDRLLSILSTGLQAGNLIAADNGVDYEYEFNSPDISQGTSIIVPIIVPFEKDIDLAQGFYHSIVSDIWSLQATATLVIEFGGNEGEEGGSIQSISTTTYNPDLYTMAAAEFKTSEEYNVAASDPDPNYTLPINDTPIDIPQLDQSPNTPLKKFAQQSLVSAADTSAYAEAYAKYEGALDANDTIWAAKLQIECYNYTSKMVNDDQTENVLSGPALNYLQAIGYQPTESDIISAENAIGQNGLPSDYIQILKEMGYNDHEINSIKNLTLMAPTSLIVNYNETIPNLINLSQQQDQELNNQYATELNVSAPPSAQFTSDVTSGFGPLTVTFTDESIRNSTQWSWDFGDGQESNLENPVHTYQNPGNYTVSLTASNGLGSDTRTQYNYIIVDGFYPPDANFTSNVTTGAAPLTVQFSDISTNSPTYWIWNIGDGNSSVLQNPTYTYSNVGNYTVTLTAGNDAGMTSVTQYINVSAPVVAPVASFVSNATSGTAPLTVQFNDTSLNSPTSWSWSFGDGTYSSLQNVTHTFGTAGNYTVSLTVTNAGGSNTDTIINYIQVNAPQTSQGVTVALKNSLGQGISGATVNYYSNGWKSFGTTNANGLATSNIAPGTYTFQMNYGGGTQNLLQTVISSSVVTFQTTNVTVKLLDSKNNLITGPGAGSVQYYANGWKTFGSTNAGICSLELLPLSYTFQMDYAGGAQNLLQNVSVSPTVTFQTTNVTTELIDGNGNLITAANAGSVQYYANGWKTFGSTNGGSCSLELLPVSYTFQMVYVGTSNNIPQNISQNSLVIFQAPNATVKLVNSAGNPLSSGIVTYYANGWKPFGTTDSTGSTMFNMLPGAYSFQMTYAGGTNTLIQNTSVNLIVNFQTGQVISSSGNVTQYYANGWRTFSNGIELLPNIYQFKYANGTSVQYTINGGTTNTIQ